MRLPTASKVALSTACTFPWSTRAPRAPYEAASAASAKGNDVHAVAEKLVRGEVVEWEALAPEVAALARGAELYLAAKGLKHQRAEVPLAYDVTTGVGRELPGAGHRAYDTRKRTEIAGTTDVLALVAPGHGIVVDWKTGSGARQHDAADSWQLRTLALAAARAFRWRTVSVALVHLEPSDYYEDAATFGAWEIDEAAEAMAAIYAEIEADEMAPRPGAHCYEQWCPIRALCPTTKAALVQIDADAASFIPRAFEVSSDDEARRARVVLRLVDEARAKLDESLKSYVRQKGSVGVDMGNGKAYGLREQSRETVTLTQAAAEVLIEAGAADALEMSTSKAAIQRALAVTKTKRGEAKRATDAVVETLREMGCVRTSTFDRMEDFDSTTNDTKKEIA